MESEIEAMMGYRKFCYWTDREGLRKVTEGSEDKGFHLEAETRVPCRVLRASRDLGHIAPAAWDGFCKRRTSWYQRSDKAGKFLVVSHASLAHLDIGDPILITDSDFKPDRLPSLEEIGRLANLQEFQKRKPPVWEKADPAEKEFYRRWFERHRSHDEFDFDRIFSHHSANHANFIDPLFFIEQNGTRAPYSIGDSLHVCSSCLEFFNVLGSQWSVKYVVPCIGAVQFAHLTMDQYFKVLSEQGE